MIAPASEALLSFANQAKIPRHATLVFRTRLSPGCDLLMRLGKRESSRTQVRAVLLQVVRSAKCDSCARRRAESCAKLA